MNKRKLNRLKKKWQSSDKYAGSIYAEMRRDGFRTVFSGDWKDLMCSVCDIIRFNVPTTEKQIDFITSLREFTGRFTYCSDCEGDAIYAPKTPNEFSVYVNSYDVNLKLLLANIITKIAKTYNMSAKLLLLQMIYCITLCTPGVPTEYFLLKEDSIWEISVY